jgi:hypothetical protein
MQQIAGLCTLSLSLSLFSDSIWSLGEEEKDKQDAYGYKVRIQDYIYAYFSTRFKETNTCKIHTNS